MVDETLRQDAALRVLLLDSIIGGGSYENILTIIDVSLALRGNNIWALSNQRYLKYYHGAAFFQLNVALWAKQGKSHLCDKAVVRLP